MMRSDEAVKVKAVRKAVYQTSLRRPEAQNEDLPFKLEEGKKSSFVWLLWARKIGRRKNGAGRVNEAERPVGKGHSRVFTTGRTI